MQEYLWDGIKRDRLVWLGDMHPEVRTIGTIFGEEETIGRGSLCHGWASGPTARLTAHVLGIKLLEPGCKVIAVQPHLGKLQFAEGTFPTPYGYGKSKTCKTGRREHKK